MYSDDKITHLLIQANEKIEELINNDDFKPSIKNKLSDLYNIIKDTKQILKTDETKKDITEIIYILENYLNESPISILLIDKEGKLIWVNKEFCKYWDYKQNNINKYNVFKDKQLLNLGITDEIKKAFNNEIISIEQHSYSAKDNNNPENIITRKLEAKIIPIKINNDDVDYIMIMQQDMTHVDQLVNELHEKNSELKIIVEKLNENNIEIQSKNEKLISINAELEKQITNAEEANQSKNNFLANMSHEIRTPLNSITGYTQLLEIDGHTTEHQRSYLSKITESARNLQIIINDILDLSKLEAGRYDVLYKDISLKKLIQSCIDILKPKIDEKRLEIQVLLDYNIPDKISIDEIKLRQIILNLLSNAIKFTLKGKITITAKLEENDRLQVKIADTGIGIEPEHLEKIFSTFIQIDTSTTRKYGGSGLGLDLCKKLVEILDGEIWVESQKDKGSTFYFTVSMGKTDENSKLMSNNLSELIKQIDFKNEVTFLLVDDDLITQRFITNLASHCHFNLEVADNGLDGIEKLKEKHIDLVLMDIAMPKMNGFEATRQIKAKPEWKNIPVIAMTSYAMPNDKERCLETGCNDYIAKPVSVKKLLALCQKWTGQTSNINDLQD